MPSAFACSAISGREGAIRRGGVVAATLASWSLLPGAAPGSWAFTARLSQVDAFHLSQGPDTLVLVLGRTRWRWRGVSFVVADGHVRATVDGLPEEL